MKSVEFEIWSINKWLRWFGFRLFVRMRAIQAAGLVKIMEPTKVGIAWTGLYGSRRWRLNENDRLKINESK